MNLDRVFYVPGAASALDWAVERNGKTVGAFCGLTLDELATDHPGVTVGTEEAFHAAQWLPGCTEPVAITESAYFDAQCFRPARDHVRHGRDASFKAASSGPIARIYARRGASFWSFCGLASLPHGRIMETVQAAQDTRGNAVLTSIDESLI